LRNDKHRKKNDTIKIAYFVVNEDLYSPLLRRQVVELLQDIKKRSDRLEITIFLFQSLTALSSKRQSIKYLHKELKETGIHLVVLPNICPWPVPNVSLRKTDVGWRPNGVWNRWAARFFSVYAQLFMIQIFLLGKFDIFHCRSYPASFAAILTKKLFPKLKLLFDPRSDFPEEHVVDGSWAPNSKDFMFWKQAERNILQSADKTACISKTYAHHFSENAKYFSYFIAPNNVRVPNFTRIENERNKMRQKLGIKDSDPVFVYLGGMSSNGWHRPEFYIKFYDALKKYNVNAVFLFLVPSHSNSILNNTIDERNNIYVFNPAYDEVRDYLSVADFGMMFTHKKRLAVGTKLGEYLSASLPILTNPNCLGAVDFLNSYEETGTIIHLGLGDLDKIFNFTDNSFFYTMKLLSNNKKVRISECIFDNNVISDVYFNQYKLLHNG
jgi:hypothetical protein